MQRYLETSEQVLQELDSTPQGLSAAEAEARLAKNGKNKLDEGKKDSLLKRFWKALCDPMIFMLLGAALISTLTTVYQNVVQHENESYADLFIILFVVSIVVSFFTTSFSIEHQGEIEDFAQAEQMIRGVLRWTTAASGALALALAGGIYYRLKTLKH